MNAAPPAESLTSTPVVPPTSPEPAVEWSFNPWREHPGRSALGAAAALALCVAVLALREPPLVSLGLCVVAVAALAPVIAPARCRIDATGVARFGPFGWERRPWDALRRARAGRRGVLLSPYARPHWLDPWRAVFLPLPEHEAGPDRGDLLERLRRHGLA